ncbi:MAG TPA: hypothetical protein VKY56_10765 [Chloroflexota bacterium]|nr:hypothetical protein [Chloroflexota bacterium]
MELRQYWQILTDHAAVVIGTFLVGIIAAAASVFLIPQVATPYTATFSIAVEPRPEPRTGSYYTYDSYYAYVASEYFNDDLIKVLESDHFLQAVRSRLASFPGGPPTGTITGEKAHRIIEVTVTSATAEGARALARAVVEEITAPDAKRKYFDAISAAQDPTVTVIDQPRIVSGPAGRNAILNIGARSLVGLILGAGLAFLLAYLDDTVQPGDVPRLVGLPVIGEIPGRGLPTPRKK